MVIASTLEVVAVADLPVAARSSNYLLTRRMTYHEDGRGILAACLSLAMLR